MESWEWGIKNSNSPQQDYIPSACLDVSRSKIAGNAKPNNASKKNGAIRTNRHDHQLYSYTIESSSGTTSDNDGPGYEVDPTIRKILVGNAQALPPRANGISSTCGTNLFEIESGSRTYKGYGNISDNPCFNHLHNHSRYTQKVSGKKRRPRSLYKSTKNRAKHKGLASTYWVYKYWSPFLVIGLFVGLVTALIIAEVLIIHFAHKYVPNGPLESDYYASENLHTYPSLMLWGEGADGLTRLKGQDRAAEVGLAGNFYNNFATYEDEHRSHHSLVKKSEDAEGHKSFPIFVSLGNVPMMPPINLLIPKSELDRNDEPESPREAQPFAQANHDTTFQRAKDFLLKSNQIPKHMPSFPPITSPNSKALKTKGSLGLIKPILGKPQSEPSQEKKERAQTVYLKGTGLRSHSYHDNLIVKYEPHQPFNLLALLPKGLRPSVYYNALLLKQSVNEARFRLLILNHSRSLLTAIKAQLLNLPKDLNFNFNQKLMPKIDNLRMNNLIRDRHEIDRLKHHKMAIVVPEPTIDSYFDPNYLDSPWQSYKDLCPAIPPHIEGDFGKAQGRANTAHLAAYHHLNSSINHLHNRSREKQGNSAQTNKFHSTPNVFLNNSPKTIPLLPDTSPFFGAKSWHQLKLKLPRVANGGAWTPEGCIARHRLAVIIPYRDREEHLFRLLNSLHPFLQRQGISYKIYVVEQQGKESFNKAILMNAAFKEAFLEHRFHCYAFHDVDLIPENDRNFYTCPKQPRHLSVAIDEMGYKLKYQMLVGGVLMFQPEHFLSVNGYSNLYWGWGAEDDDMANRIQHSNLFITRPPEQIGRYRMIKHVKRTPMSLIKRYSLLSYGVQRIQIDGLNSNSYTIVKTIRYPLYTYFLLNIGLAPKGF